MNITELFAALQTDSRVVVARFAGNEALLERFVKKFPQDNSYNWLMEAAKKEDYEDVQRAAHTLKGVAMNLGFSALGEHCAELVIAMRELKTDAMQEILNRITFSYEEIIDLIKELD